MAIPGASNIEAFLTAKQAAAQLGVHYWLLLKLIKEGSIPTYTFGNSRKRVRTSEIVSFIEASRQGGAQ